MKSTSRHVDFLDSLRGVAILAVLLFHTLGMVFGYDELPWDDCFRDFSQGGAFLYFLPVSIGSVGVPIFFVISGFCIHLSFHSQGRHWGSFSIRRIFRLYPAYLVALIFFAAMYAQYYQIQWTNPLVLTQLTSHLFFWHNFSNGTIGAINGSFWSIAVEAQLYLLYPGLLFLVSRLNWRRTLFLLGGIELLIRGSHGLADAMGGNDTAFGATVWKLFVSPLGFWFSWSIGSFIADRFLKNQPLPFTQVSPLWWVGLATICYFVRPLDPFRFLLFALATAGLISQLLQRADGSAKTPILSWSLVKKFGLWSYSLYLLHQPLLQVYSYVINWAVPTAERTVAVAWLLNLTSWLPIILLSVLLHQLVELPGIRWGKHFIQKLQRTGATKEIGQPTQSRMHLIHLVTGWKALILLAGGTYWLDVKLVPPSPSAINNVAWSLATNPDSTKRDGTLAVKLAEDACQRTQYQETILVGTLAAAYAEVGRFNDASNTAELAIELASKNGETVLLKRNRELLERYQRHEAVRE